MKSLILGINTMYMLFCFFKVFLVGCIGLNKSGKDLVGNNTVDNFPGVSLVWFMSAGTKVIPICSRTGINSISWIGVNLCVRL